MVAHSPRAQLRRYGRRPGNLGLAATGAALYGQVVSGYRKWRSSGSKAAASAKRKVGEDGSPVTQYHEDRLVYRRRRAPRRVRRRARAFRTRFTKQLTSFSSPQTVVRNYGFELTAPVGEQGLGGVTVYPVNGTAGTDNDLIAMFSNILPTDGVAATALNNRLMFTSAMVDITFQNQSTGNAPLWLDIYYIRCRRDTSSLPSVDWGSFSPEIWTGETAITNVTPGLSPYNSRDFTKHWVINKHRRILLAPAQVTEVCLVDRRDLFVDKQDFLSNANTVTQVGKSGITSGIVFSIQGASLQSESPWEPVEVNIAAFITKTYMVRIPPGAGAITTGLL